MVGEENELFLVAGVTLSPITSCSIAVTFGLEKQCVKDRMTHVFLNRRGREQWNLVGDYEMEFKGFIKSSFETKSLGDMSHVS